MYNISPRFTYPKGSGFVSKLVKVAHLSEIKPGKMLRVKAQDKTLLLANIEQQIYAVDDMCTHEDASLYNGALKGHCVECPLHGSHFDLRTGQPQHEPATEALQTYKVHVEENEIFVEL